MAELARDERQRAIWSYFQGEGAESFSRAGPRLDHLTRRLQARVRAGRVLTVGVGDGYLERRVGSLHYDHVAMDPDVAAISDLRDITGVPGVLEALPFADESFDAVLASEVLEHLDPARGAAALREIDRVLRPGGWLLGTVPYDEQLQDGIVVCPCCGERFHRWGHQRSFDRASLRRELNMRLDVRRVDVRAFPKIRGRGPAGMVKGVVRWVLGRRGVAVTAPVLVFEAQRRATRER